MSKVINQPDKAAGAGGAGTGQQGQGAPADQGQQDWVLDEGQDRPKQRWVMDEGPLEQQERQELREQFRQQQGGQQGGGGQGAPGGGGGTPTPAARPQFVPGAQPGQGFQYTTKSGYTFRGPTPDAVLEQMENALVGMVGRIQQVESARTFMGGQGGYDRGTSPGQQGRQGAQQQDTWTPAAYDPVKFYTLLAKEQPLEAMKEIIVPLLQEYFGVEDPRHALDRSYTVAAKVEDSLETADFLSHNPHFPASDTNAELVLRRIEQANVPLTRWNLEVAFNQLIQERVIVPTQQQPQFQGGNGAGGQGDQGGWNFQSSQTPPISRGQGAPPPPGGSGDGGIGDSGREMSEMEFETLSTKDQRAYLVKHGLI